MKKLVDMYCPTTDEIKALLKSKDFSLGFDPRQSDLLKMYDICIDNGYLTSIYDLKFIFDKRNSDDLLDSLKDKILANYNVTKNLNDKAYLDEMAALFGYGTSDFQIFRDILKKMGLSETRGTGNRACFTGIKK